MKNTRVLRAGLVIAALGLLLAGCSDDTNTNPDSGTPDAGQVDSGTPDSGTPDGGEVTHYDVTILHTNDLHSYVNSQGPILDYSPSISSNDNTIGGFARLAARIKAERTAAGDQPVLLFDSGDFSMGTAFEAIGTTDAPELTEMAKMGYDAITFGNHEFDYTPLGLAGYLQKATANGFATPIVASNLVFSDEAADTGDDALKNFQTAGLIRSKVVKTLSNGLKVGIFGLLGKDAVNVAPLAAPITFADQKTTAEAMVDELRNSDGVDLVILISHSGSHPDGTGEDVDLAKAVPGIDIIISGHTHDAIPQPIQPEGTKTLIVQSGSYASNLGELKVTFTKGGDTPGLALDSYQLIPLDDSLVGDADTQTRVDGYIQDIDDLLAAAGAPVTYAGVVAQTPSPVEDIQFQESPLGDLVTDSYLTTVQALQAAEGLPQAEVAIEVGGNIRTSLKGDSANGLVTFADLFRVVPLGIAEDQVPGYPLVTFYLTGREIKSGLEISAAAKSLLNNDDYFIQVSGLNYSFSTSANLFGRVTATTIGGVDITADDTCHQVVATQYVASLLGLASTVSSGAVVVIPKQADCSTAIPVAELGQYVVDRDPATAGVQPLHQWQAFLGYVGAFPPNAQSVPTVPDTYLTAQGRITIDP